MNQPYSRFFWRDYEQDLNLSACHPFAQAIWMRMLCVMQQGEPYGYLRMEPREAARIPAPAASGGGSGSAGGPPRGGAGGGPHGVPSGIAPGVPSGHHGGVPGGGLEGRYKLPKNGSLEHLIFSRCGVTEDQMAWSIAHLEEHGVFSRTPEGIIYCRRMVRERQQHMERVERAKKAREIYERKKGKNPPGNSTRKAALKSGNGVDTGVESGGPSGIPRGGPSGVPRGGPSGVPGGRAITITSSTENPPPDPPSPNPGERGTPDPLTHTPRKPPHDRVLEEARAVMRRRAGGAT